VLFGRFELSLARRGHQPDYSTFVAGPRPPCVVRYRRRRTRGPVAAPAPAVNPR
jgi:sterol 14alpha-demethylase